MAAITTSADDALVLSGQGDRATPEALLRSLTASNATEQLSGLPRNLFFATNLSDFFSQWVESVFIGTNPARRDHRSEQPTRPSQAPHQPSTSSTQPLPDSYQQQGRAYKRSRTPPPLPHTDNRPTSRYDGTTTHTCSHTHKTTEGTNNNILGGKLHNLTLNQIRVGAVVHSNNVRHNHHNSLIIHNLHPGQTTIGRTIGRAETGGTPLIGADPSQCHTQYQF